MHDVLVNPFAEIGSVSAFPRGFNPAKFAADIEPAPAFVRDPRPEYLRACEIKSILKVIAGR